MAQRKAVTSDSWLRRPRDRSRGLERVVQRSTTPLHAGHERLLLPADPGCQTRPPTARGAL
ncbi:hypothetical protein T484DRAFT_1897005, partial [Baffinella frigidus]